MANIKVTSKQDAWNKVNQIFPTDYEQDVQSSTRAGYPVYRSTAEGHFYDYICDLGDRLEVNLDSSHLETANIWKRPTSGLRSPPLRRPRCCLRSGWQLPSGSSVLCSSSLRNTSRNWKTRPRRMRPLRPCRPTAPRMAPCSAWC